MRLTSPITSPYNNNQPTSSENNIKQYTIPDETNDQSTLNFEESETVKLSSGAKKRLEVLLGLTKLTKTINIVNTDFILQTLKSHQFQNILNQASELKNGLAQDFKIRNMTLAYSLIKISGIDTDQFIGRSIEEKVYFINQLDEYILSRLYDEYLILKKESEEKYSLKNSEEISEFVEDIKK